MFDVTEVLLDSGVENGRRWWEIRSLDSGKVYRVWDAADGTPMECSCPHFLYRLKDKGGRCKHMEMLEGVMSYIGAEAA